MRLVWSLPLVFLVLLASQTPAQAMINRVGDAYSMSGSCDGTAMNFAPGEYDQAIRTLNGELARERQGDATVNATAIAGLSAAIAQLQRCKLQALFMNLIVDAHFSCTKLLNSVRRLDAVMKLQEQIFGQQSSAYYTVLLSNFQTAVRACWLELALKCIEMDDRNKAGRLADVLRAARYVGLTRADLIPPIHACTSTIPYCAPGEPIGDCRLYLEDVAEILFGDGPPPVPTIADIAAGAGR